MRYLGFIYVFLMSCAAWAQQAQVTYRDYPAITWQDFWAKVPVAATYVASISTGMHYQWSCSYTGNDVTFEYEIQAQLSRHESWSKYRSGKLAVLQHEQLHYDITELHARKLRKAFAEYVPVVKTIKKDLKQIYERIEQERKQMQEAYDHQTNHSLEVEAQKQWEQQVALWLTEYADYR